MELKEVCEFREMEVRGSGWYRMAFAVHPAPGGSLKQEPDQESLHAEWHMLVRRKKTADGLALRCRDFLLISAEAERYGSWKRWKAPRLEQFAGGWASILNSDEAQIGLFADFVILRQIAVGNRLNALSIAVFEISFNCLTNSHC